MSGAATPSVDSTTLLDNVDVVELSRHVPGAYCGKILAQLGASVTRFGPPTDVAGSDDTRKVAQAIFHGGKHNLPLEHALVTKALAGARLVIVEKDDIDDPLAAIVDELIARRTGMNPDAALIVVSASGNTDGYHPGCGLTSSAWASMTWAIGEPTRTPLAPPYDIIEHETGASAAAAALVTLLADAGPRCQPVDVASRDVIAHFVSMLAQNYLPYGRPWQRDGRRPFMSGGIYPVGLFTCKDGYVALYCRSTHEWHGIMKAMGSPAWTKDEKFNDPRIVARKHADEADTHLLPWLAAHTKTELMDLGLEFGFPAAPVRFVGEALDDPQFGFRRSLAPVTLDDGRRFMAPTAPWRLQETAARTATPRSWPAQAGPRKPSEFLKGVRVLDLSWVWSGPLVNSILADLGAEVIKVEHPSRLDSVRQRGRPIRDGKEAEGPVAELNPWFNQLNHGKRSIILDMKSPEDRERILKLAATCDIVVENMRPGALAKLGVGYEQLSAVNPSLVMLSMSLAGQAGPLSHMKGYAGIMTSMAGLEALVGYDEDDGSQTVVGMAKTALGDPNAATHAICVLMAALHRRKRTGRGLWIDLSQTDAILSILAGPLLESQLHGVARVLGNGHSIHAPHGLFRCQGENSYVALAVCTEHQWSHLVTVIPGLSSHARLDAAGRRAHRRDIEATIEAWTSQRRQRDIVEQLARLRVPVAPVADYESMSTAPWRAQRGLTCVVDHPYIGRQEVVVPPWRFGTQSAGVDRPAPLLGADTDDVLKTLAATRATRHAS